jgi:hypothetical protein
MKVKLLKELRKENTWEFVGEKIILNNKQVFDNSNIFGVIHEMTYRSHWVLFNTWRKNKLLKFESVKINNLRKTGKHE